MQAQLILTNGTFAAIDVNEGPMEGGYVRLSCDMLGQLAQDRGMNIDYLWYSLHNKPLLMRAVTNLSDSQLLEKFYQELLKETQ